MNTTTYTSTIAGRTAEHSEKYNTVTVFQAGLIVAEVTVSDTVTPGEVWEIVNAEYAPELEIEMDAPEVTVTVQKTTKAPKLLGKRYGYETYGLRGHVGRKSDMVRRYSRRIGDARYDFQKIQWATGETELRVYLSGTTTLIHSF